MRNYCSDQRVQVMKIENNVLVKVDNSDINNGEFVIP